MKELSCACQSNGTSAIITPVSPPATKMASAPDTNSIGTAKITRPSSMVAMKAKICTPVGSATASEAAEKKRSEEHTSELQSLMRISYAVFCLKKKTHNNTKN